MVAPLVQATMSRGIGHRLTRPTPPGAARIGKQSGGVFSRAAVRSSGCFAAFASRRLPANRTARSGRRPSNGPTMTTTTSCETTSRSSSTPTTTPEDGRPAKARHPRSSSGENAKRHPKPSSQNRAGDMGTIQSGHARLFHDLLANAPAPLTASALAASYP